MSGGNKHSDERPPRHIPGGQVAFRVLMIRWIRTRRLQAPGTDGTVTLYRALFQETSPGAEAGHSAVDYNSELGTPEPIYKMS